MNLEVGMYYRTEDGKIGIITEVRDISQKLYAYDDIQLIRNISKASHNIIDLIEEKDVLKIYTDNIVGKCEVKKDNEGLYIINPVNIRMPISYFDENKEHCWWIESILTHEQFEANTYTVKE